MRFIYMFCGWKRGMGADGTRRMMEVSRVLVVGPGCASCVPQKRALAGAAVFFPILQVGGRVAIAYPPVQIQISSLYSELK